MSQPVHFAEAPSPITRTGRPGRAGFDTPEPIGPAVIRNSTGDTWVGEASGILQVETASGKVSVDRADADVAATTAHGDIHLGAVARGAIVAQTGWGSVEVGVRAGIAAWLDLQTHSGQVISELESAGPPPPGEDVIHVRARTPYGDLTVRRSQPVAWQR